MAAFWWEQPAWLVVVLAAACGAGVATWPTMRHKAMRLVSGLLAAAIAVGLGIGLVYLGTSGALVVLGLLAFAAAAWLTTMLLRRQGGGLTPLTRTILIGLRCLAWALLLVLLARPVWEQMVVEWHRPLLVALLDQSDSLGIVDPDEEGADQTRAQIANAALRGGTSAIGRLDTLYEVRLRGFGAGQQPLSSWELVPATPVSALSSVLRGSGEMRSRYGKPPLAVLLLSDGADNVAAPGELRRAAASLAVQGSALLAVGVGPAPGQTPLVELEPLVLPERLGMRDRLRVPVSARVQGCAGSTVGVEILWNGEPTASRAVRVDYDIQHVDDEFDLIPPGLGVHRLTARVTLPSELGGVSFHTSATVDVRAERIHVLWLEGTPRVEAAFVPRVLRGDPQLELTRRFLYTDTEPFGDEDVAWADYDVVVLGSIPAVLSDQLLDELAQAVTQRGVGLLLAGGRQLFNDEDYGRTALASVSPVSLGRERFGLTGPVRFVPTEPGLRHPVLLGAAAAQAVERATPADERAVWLELPPLGGAASLGEPRPAAAVLAEDGAGRPLLVAQEVGRGRCVAAAWESTWPWALASDEGAGLHARLWRQLVVWLANRRPRAWVLTDQSAYSLAALAAGQHRVRIRAGVSGLDPGGDATAARDAEARLVLKTRGKRQELRLRRRGEEWTADLPSRSGSIDFPSSGEYTLDFTVTGLSVRDASGAEGDGRSTADLPASLTASTGFTVAEAQLERQPPTADLAMLRAAAEETAAQGGGYYEIHELPELLESLAKTDRREEIRTRRRHSVVEREPWVLLSALLIALSLEWVIRKRIGLS